MTRKNRYLLAVLLLINVHVANAQSSESRSISYIETTESWIRIFDESGKNYYTDSRSRFGEVVGYSSSFFIIRRGSFYVLYDPNIRPLNTLLASNIGEILSVAGDTFTARKNSFIITYDKTGKRLWSKMVH